MREEVLNYQQLLFQCLNRREQGSNNMDTDARQARVRCFNASIGVSRVRTAQGDTARQEQARFNASIGVSRVRTRRRPRRRRGALVSMPQSA